MCQISRQALFIACTHMCSCCVEGHRKPTSWSDWLLARVGFRGAAAGATGCLPFQPSVLAMPAVGVGLAVCAWWCVTRRCAPAAVLEFWHFLDCPVTIVTLIIHLCGRKSVLGVSVRAGQAVIFSAEQFPCTTGLPVSAVLLARRAGICQCQQSLGSSHSGSAAVTRVQAAVFLTNCSSS